MDYYDDNDSPSIDGYCQLVDSTGEPTFVQYFREGGGYSTLVVEEKDLVVEIGMRDVAKETIPNVNTLSRGSATVAVWQITMLALVTSS